MAPKDPGLKKSIDQLHLDLGPGYFVEVPHWDGDLVAVGLARPDNPDVLVYVRWYPTRRTFYIECEVPTEPTNDDLPYAVVRTEDDIDYLTVRAIVASHLAPPGHDKEPPARHVST